jgi:hypothetical protein
MSSKKHHKKHKKDVPSIEIIVKETKNPTDDLTEEQFKILKEFQERLYDLTDEQDKKFCDIPCLIRYLVARDWNLNKSDPMLRETLRWRKEFGVEKLLAKDLAEEGSTGKLYVSGFDKLRRPVIYMRPDRENSTNYENQLKLLVYTLERGVRLMGDGVSQLVWIIDFAGYNGYNYPPLSQCSQTIKILSDHYPERLGACFIMNAPWLFGIFWRAVSVFVNAKTVSKVIMVSSNKEEQKSIMHKHFDPVELEKDFGGEREFTWDPAKYWGTLVVEEESAVKNLPVKLGGVNVVVGAKKKNSKEKLSHHHHHKQQSDDSEKLISSTSTAVAGDVQQQQLLSLQQQFQGLAIDDNTIQVNLNVDE